MKKELKNSSIHEENLNRVNILNSSVFSLNQTRRNSNQIKTKDINLIGICKKRAEENEIVSSISKKDIPVYKLNIKTSTSNFNTESTSRISNYL